MKSIGFNNRSGCGVFGLIAVFVFAAGFSGKGLEFAIHGDVQVTRWNVDTGEARKVEALQFEFLRRNALWYAKLIPDDPNVDFYEAGTDGTFCYLLETYRKGIERLKADGIEAAGAAAYARIVPTLVPYHVHDAQRTFGVLWFLFGSSDYLNSVPDDLYYAPHISQGDSFEAVFHGRALRGEIERFADPPGLPKAAVFFRDGTIRRYPRGHHFLQGEPSKVTIPSLDLEGSISGRLITQEPATLGAVSFAGTSRYEIFSLKRETPPLITLEIRVTNILPTLRKKSLLPAMTVDTIVQDYRFIHASDVAPPFTYQTRQWLSVDEVMQTAEYKRALGMGTAIRSRPPETSEYKRALGMGTAIRSRPPETSYSHRRLVTIIAVALALIPGLLVLWWIRRAASAERER